VTLTAQEKLDALFAAAVAAPDEDARVAVIDSVAPLLNEMDLGHEEWIALARDWIRRVARVLAEREWDATKVAQFREFLGPREVNVQ